MSEIVASHYNEILFNQIVDLNSFFKEKNVDYCITGTAALFLLGLTPHGQVPVDIDIIAICNNDNRNKNEKIFSELDNLNGKRHQEVNYSNAPYYFRVGGIVNSRWVNVFLENNDSLSEKNIAIMVNGVEINVMPALSNLKRKFVLRRQKDYMFWNDLQNEIINFFNH